MLFFLLKPDEKIVCVISKDDKIRLLDDDFMYYSASARVRSLLSLQDRGVRDEDVRSGGGHEGGVVVMMVGGVVGCEGGVGGVVG